MLAKPGFAFSSLEICLLPLPPVLPQDPGSQGRAGNKQGEASPRHRGGGQGHQMKWGSIPLSSCSLAWAVPAPLASLIWLWFPSVTLFPCLGWSCAGGCSQLPVPNLGPENVIPWPTVHKQPATAGLRTVFHPPCSRFPGPVSVCVYVSALWVKSPSWESLSLGARTCYHLLPTRWGAGQSHLSPSEHSNPF